MKLTKVLMAVAVLATLTFVSCKPKDADIKAAIETAIKADPMLTGAMVDVKEHSWFKPFFNEWGRDHVYFLSDVYSKLFPNGIPKIWIGSVESIVCSRARVFVGTRKSTFSGYIHRMRGYMNDVGQKEILDAQAQYPEDYYHALVGPSWGKFPHNSFDGGHPYWGREYKESWEGVYNPFY